MSKQPSENEEQEKKIANKENLIIEFIAPYQRYANGDVAGFDIDVAKKILGLKPAVAKAYQENPIEPSEQTE